MGTQACIFRGWKRGVQWSTWRNSLTKKVQIVAKFPVKNHAKNRAQSPPRPSRIMAGGLQNGSRRLQNRSWSLPRHHFWKTSNLGWPRGSPKPAKRSPRAPKRRTRPSQTTPKWSPRPSQIYFWSHFFAVFFPLEICTDFSSIFYRFLVAFPKVHLYKTL